MKKIKTMKDLVNYLILCNKKISTMESCTGGDVANEITNIEGASNIFGFGMVTYSNEYKIKQGVNKKTIEEYTVYSLEVANEMSRVVQNYTSSDYAVGITGQMRRVDPNNITNEDNKVYVSIYDKEGDKYYNKIVIMNKKTRRDNKKVVIEAVIEMFNSIL